MIALPLLLLVAAPASAAEAERPKLLVLDFRDDGVGASAVRIIHDTLAAHVSKDARLDVISSEDVRRAVERDASRREANCDDESCLAEIAEALGAQLTLYGNAGKLGDLVVVTVSLYDASAGRSVGRENVEVSSLEALPPALRAAGDRLIARLALTEPPSGSPDPLFVAGAVTSGVGMATAIVGTAIWLPNIQAVQDETSFERKTSAKQAQDTGGLLAIGGTIVAVVGLGMVAAALVLE